MKTKFQNGKVGISRVITTFILTRTTTHATATDSQAKQKRFHVTGERRNRGLNPQRGGIVPAAFALLLTLGIALAALISTALAQAGYSVEGANRYVRAKDWNGLGQYASAWTKAEPNNPVAWYYLGNNYATGLQHPRRRFQHSKRSCGSTRTGTGPGKPSGFNS